MIGNVILEKRKGLNLSQEQVAQQIGTSARAVGKWERGEADPPSSFIVPLCHLFRCTPSELLNGREYYKLHPEFYTLEQKLLEYTMAYPNVMELLAWIFNKWDGEIPPTILMMYFYTTLDTDDRTHLSYLHSMFFKQKYEFAERTKEQELAFKMLPEYVESWKKLNEKAEKERKVKYEQIHRKEKNEQI